MASALGTLDAFAGRTTEQVKTMSEGLSAVASSGDVLARFAAEAAAFVTSVEEGIDAVRRRAGETGDLARVVTATAERGEALVNDSVQGMYRVEESIRRAAEIVDALGQRSQEIGRIVDVIQEVADQTNLLSLNAAIIAAQAGEQGQAVRGGGGGDPLAGRAHRPQHPGDRRHRPPDARATWTTAVVHVKEGRERATAGVALGDRAASALKEIRGITQRTFAAVEATVAETGRLETQGAHVVKASARVAARIVELTRASVEQADAGRDLVRQTQEMARLAQGASAKAEGQARTGRALSDAVHRLTDALDRDPRRARGAHPGRRGHLRGRRPRSAPTPRPCSASATGSPRAWSSSPARRRASRPRSSASGCPSRGGAARCGWASTSRRCSGPPGGWTRSSPSTTRWWRSGPASTPGCSGRRTG